MELPQTQVFSLVYLGKYSRGGSANVYAKMPLDFHVNGTPRYSIKWQINAKFGYHV
jgi:hypothetical protein